MMWTTWGKEKFKSTSALESKCLKRRDGVTNPQSKNLTQKYSFLKELQKKSGEENVNFILGILNFWANIHLSVSAYHVFSFVIGLPHSLGYLTQDDILQMHPDAKKPKKQNNCLICS